jgi:hypothetical protein
LFVKDPKRRVFMLVLFHALRNDPAFADAFQQIRDTSSNWQTNGYPAWKRVRFLLGQLPATRQVLGEARIREAFKRSGGWESLSGEVAVFRSEHADEIDHIVAAHPEVFGQKEEQGPRELEPGT